MSSRLSFVTACLVLSFVAALPAAPKAQGLGDPGKIKAVAFEGLDKNGFALAGRDAFRQLVVTGEYASGQTRDLSGSAKYDATPAGIVEVDSTGLVTPRKEGTATIRVSVGGAKAETRVAVTHQIEDLPVSFVHQIVPVFTKFGCNGGACHGKSEGQNGFKLSLLGFEPWDDYERLVSESRGRRLSLASPESSLLLVKATGTMPHGGGRKLEPDAPHYKLLRRWIEQGTPRGSEADPGIVRIQVLPSERLLDLGGRQQLAVLAHLSDGSVQDVTRLAQFETNTPEVAGVSGTGLVTAGQTSGIAGVMVRYQSLVDVFRATVPLGVTVENLPTPNSFVDELLFAQLQRLGLPPSGACDDGTFLRRATIDLAGRLPTIAEVEEFLASQDPQKDEKLIDRLLASREHAEYFANKWSAVLRNRRPSDKEQPGPTVAFYNWIRDQLQANRPYDAFVREILTASGEAGKVAPVIWYREVKDSSAQLEDAAQLFLGQRIQCARCHHHPFEKWSQHDYYGMAAFFSRLEVKEAKVEKKGKKDQSAEPAQPFSVAHKPGKAEAKHPKTGDAVMPTGLGGTPVALSDKDDPREKLSDWMAEPENPFFARTLVNRYWKHFFGRGLVDPEDDMRVTNPPTNPQLLDALAKHFVDSKYDLRGLVRLICTSRAYRRSAVPNDYNADDRQNFSRFAPRRLHAEVLLDAINAVTRTSTKFGAGTPDGTRAVALPDNQSNSYFLSVFGRPDSASACECERSGDASLAQCLHLFNSPEILDKVNGSRAKDLAKDKRPHEERLRELYLSALSREPTEAERKSLLAHIERKSNDPTAAYADIVWALINTKEFLFNH